MAISRSRFVIGALLCSQLLSTGCAFTQWDDRYFLGSTQKPVHDGRFATGIFILPFAMIGDVATAPIQGLLLVILGDRSIYSHAVPKTMKTTQDPTAAKETRREVPPARLHAAVARAEELQRQNGDRPVTVGLTKDGTIVDLHLPPAELQKLRAHAAEITAAR